MINKCRSCYSPNLVNVLSLKNQYLSDFVKGNDKPEQYPLNLVLCTNCTLVQLRESIPVEKLYTENYGYRSGINNTIKADLRDIVAKACAIVPLNVRDSVDIVLDIGCNDGTLLSNYPLDVVRVGIDPISKFKTDIASRRITFINDFFSFEAYFNKFGYAKTKIITAISVFYDLENPNKFISDIVKILDKDGIFIIQQNYLLTMLQNVAFDNIVFEHIEYYSLKSLEYLLNTHGLEVFDVEVNTINGGSFRAYIRHMDNVKKMRLMEEKAKLSNKWTYMLFSIKTREICKKVYSFIKQESEKGKIIYLYGASTRGNSLIQACGLDNKMIKAAVERNPEKWGKKIVSLQIPIISEEQGRKDKPDYMLVLPWQFKEEFLVREKEYLKQGGHLIFPLPKFEII